MSTYTSADLSTWAAALEVRTDAAAVRELRRWAKTLSEVAYTVLDVAKHAGDAPGDAGDAFMTAYAAIQRAEEELEVLRAAFTTHKRGTRR